MSKALNFIAIQHELGMAIGLELMLRPMLRHFTKVCIRRLALAEVRLYFNHDRKGQLVLPDDIRTSTLRHFLSSTRTPCSAQCPEVNDIFEELKGDETKIVTRFNDETQEYIFYYNLRKLGLIGLHSFNIPISSELQELLKPIVERLAVSCQASIEHQHLLQATEDRKRAEEAVRFQLLHDELTQLPNRRSFMRYLDEINSSFQKRNLKAAVLFIDFDRFKTVNDTLGHSVGDQLLVAIAHTFSGVVRNHEMVARLSGDEFVMLLSETDRDTQSIYQTVEHTLSHIQYTFSHPLQAGDHLLHITPSIGVEFFPNEDFSSEQILRHADTAMYLAKAQAPNSAVIYDKKMSEELDQRQSIEKQLQTSVKQLNQFFLQYQPQFDKDLQCVGAEALVRWNHKKFSPEQFIPVAEDTGLMLELGHQILVQACNDIKRLLLDGDIHRISINVSALQFNQRTFLEQLDSIVENAGIPYETLGLEITESALITNTDEAVKKIAALKDKGVTVAIDDFGTGYSSLAYLNRLPVNALKVDQTFVSNICEDKNNVAIVETIMALGKNLNLNVMAEGVENDESLKCLRQLGCEYFQGFYFDKPLNLQEIQKYIFK